MTYKKTKPEGFNRQNATTETGLIIFDVQYSPCYLNLLLQMVNDVHLEHNLFPFDQM